MRLLPLALLTPFLTLVASLQVSPPVLAALITVPDQAPTIQDAITAAASGDSILVRAGTYAESLTLSGKDVTIFGESGAAATILSGNSTFRILDVAGPGVTTATVLADLTFRAGQAVQGAGIPAPPLHLAVHPNPIRQDATFSFDAGAGAQTLEIHDARDPRRQWTSCRRVRRPRQARAPLEPTFRPAGRDLLRDARERDGTVGDDQDRRPPLTPHCIRYRTSTRRVEARLVSRAAPVPCPSAERRKK